MSKKRQEAEGWISIGGYIDPPEAPPGFELQTWRGHLGTVTHYRHVDCRHCGGNGYTGCATEPEWCECLGNCDEEDGQRVYGWDASDFAAHGFFRPISPNMLLLRSAMAFACAMIALCALVAAL